MRKRCVVGFGVPERLERGHLHPVLGHAVKSLIAAMPDRGSRCGKERFRPFDPLHRIKPGLGDRVELRRQAVDLLDVKDGVAFHERDIPLLLFARLLVLLGAGDGRGIDDKAALLALAHMRL
jgi:hypothetical protein